MAAERGRSKSKKPFLSTSKERRGCYDFIRGQADGFGRTKPKNSIFSEHVRKQIAIREAGCDPPAPPGQLRAARAIVVVIDDFDFGRKRVSVGTASAVFRVVSSSDDLAWTPAALPAGSMRSPALS